MSLMVMAAAACQYLKCLLGFGLPGRLLCGWLKRGDGAYLTWLATVSVPLPCLLSMVHALRHGGSIVFPTKDERVC